MIIPPPGISPSSIDLIVPSTEDITSTSGVRSAGPKMELYGYPHTLSQTPDQDPMIMQHSWGSSPSLDPEWGCSSSPLCKLAPWPFWALSQSAGAAIQGSIEQGDESTGMYFSESAARRPR